MQTQAATAAPLYRAKPYFSLNACSILSSMAAIGCSASLTSFISRSFASLSEIVFDQDGLPTD
jgi:hypothetical protein